MTHSLPVSRLHSAQFSGTGYSHRVGQPSPLSGPRTLSSPAKETLCPLAATSYFSLPHPQQPPICFSFSKDFLMWTILKVFIQFVTLLLRFSILVFWPLGRWGLRSPTRVLTCIPLHYKVKTQPLDHQGSLKSAFRLNGFPIVDISYI